MLVKSCLSCCPLTRHPPSLCKVHVAQHEHIPDNVWQAMCESPSYIKLSDCVKLEAKVQCDIEIECDITQYWPLQAFYGVGSLNLSCSWQFKPSWFSDLHKAIYKPKMTADTFPAMVSITMLRQLFNKLPQTQTTITFAVLGVGSKLIQIWKADNVFSYLFPYKSWCLQQMRRGWKIGQHGPYFLDFSLIGIIVIGLISGPLNHPNRVWLPWEHPRRISTATLRPRWASGTSSFADAVHWYGLSLMDVHKSVHLGRLVLALCARDVHEARCIWCCCHGSIPDT
jgi:hypothetical protein